MTIITQQIRYQLPKKSIKADCPQCSPKHRKTLSRYVNAKTGEPLPGQYGRCDRESNCGYHLSPYHKTPLGLSYADGMCQQWKESNPLLAHQKRSQVILRQHQPPSPVYFVPDEVFTASLGQYARNQFAQLLIREFGQTKAEELLQRFQIGTSAHWPGACVFWLKDEQQRVRAGQVVLFGDDWHKATYVDKEGQTRICISSVNSCLLGRYQRQELTTPEWLTDYHENAPRWPILFGLHQLATASADQPIAIVEAPKTAVVCSARIPKFMWFAVGALSYLNADRLAPFRGRTVMLFPDLSKDGKAFARWSKVAEQLNAKGYQISVSRLLEDNANDEQKQAGLDLADFLLMPKTKVEPNDAYPPEWNELNPPETVPIIKSHNFFEWQRQDPCFGQMGLPSLYIKSI